MRFLKGIVVSVALLSVGCAQIPAQFRYHPADAELPAHVWPAEPETPRYRYVGQLTGEDNFYRPGEQTANMMVRFLRWVVGLTGHNPNPIVLQRPQAVITDDSGKVYVSDVSRHAVYVFDSVGATLQVWENAADKLRFELPIGLALDGKGGLLVADASLGYVAHLDGQGIPVGRLGAGELRHPTGIVRDPVRGRIYVADRLQNTIKVFSDDGKLLFDIGSHGEAEGMLNGPTYLAWHDNKLYVTDTLNSRIQIFSAEGEFISTFGRRGLYVGDLPRPKGVAVDKDSNVYVVESYYDYLLVFNRKGELLLPVGGAGHEIGQFYLPAGVWVDQYQRVYVADTFNGRVMIFEYLGEGDGSDLAERESSSAGSRIGGSAIQ